MHCDVRAFRHCAPQRRLHLTVLDNHRQFAQSGIVGAEVEFGACVIAENSHVFDRHGASTVDVLPGAAVLQIIDAAGAQRINAAVPAVCTRGGLWRLRFDQCDFEAGPGKAERKAAANQTAANDDYVKKHVHIEWEIEAASVIGSG